MAPNIAVADDTCNALLGHGIYNFIQSRTTRVLSRQEFSNACEQMKSAKASGMAASLSATYEAVGGSGAYSQDKYESLEKAYCATSSLSTFDLNNEESFKQVVSPDALKAWVACKKIAASPGVEFAYELDADLRTITVDIGAKEAPGIVITNLMLTNFHECTGDLKERWERAKKKGAEMRIGDATGKDDSASLVCVRKQRVAASCSDEVLESATLVIQTNKGAQYKIVASIPAERKGCPLAGCSLVQAQESFGAGPTSWPEQRECDGIPPRMRVEGTPPKGTAALWKCKGYTSGAKVTVSSAIAVRGIRSDKNVHGNCWCGGGAENEVEFQAQLKVGDRVKDSVLFVGASRDSCVGGLTDTIILEDVVVPSSGEFNIQLLPTKCRYRTETTCRFVGGTTLSVQ